MTDNTPEDKEGFDLPKCAAGEDWDTTEQAATEEMEAQAKGEAEADEVMNAIQTKGEAEEEAYPPKTMTPVEPEPEPAVEPEPEEHDEFALPDANETNKSVPDLEGSEDTVERLIAETYQGSVPAMVRTAELQKSFFRARLIFHNCFDPVKLDGGKSLSETMINEHPEKYVDAILRTAFTNYIAWQKAMGF
ncbi:MAG: hypothetical protein GY906_07805 [bacterium]|nr:hypothetical protein [bacterium]